MLQCTACLTTEITYRAAECILKHIDIYSVKVTNVLLWEETLN